MNDKNMEKKNENAYNFKNYLGKFKDNFVSILKKKRDTNAINK